MIGPHRVSERQGGSPGAAEHQPFIDREELAQLFKVSHTVIRGVICQICKWSAIPTPSLVHQNDSIYRWVEITGHDYSTAVVQLEFEHSY